MKKRLFFLCGLLLLFLGAVGVFLPVLPTTPFVILAAACFLKSSEKMYRLIVRSRFFGPFIENYRTKQGVPRKTKIRSILTLWALLALSAAVAARLWLTLFLAVVGIAVTIHILLIRTKSGGSSCLPDSGQKE